jgi:hypothetical protein
VGGLGGLLLWSATGVPVRGALGAVGLVLLPLLLRREAVAVLAMAATLALLGLAPLGPTRHAVALLPVLLWSAAPAVGRRLPYWLAAAWVAVGIARWPGVPTAPLAPHGDVLEEAAPPGAE